MWPTHSKYLLGRPNGLSSAARTSTTLSGPSPTPKPQPTNRPRSWRRLQRGLGVATLIHTASTQECQSAMDLDPAAARFQEEMRSNYSRDSRNRSSPTEPFHTPRFQPVFESDLCRGKTLLPIHTYRQRPLWFGAVRLLENSSSFGTVLQLLPPTRCPCQSSRHIQLL
jgi:hypothetical protein